MPVNSTGCVLYFFCRDFTYVQVLCQILYPNKGGAYLGWVALRCVLACVLAQGMCKGFRSVWWMFCSDDYVCVHARVFVWNTCKISIYINSSIESVNPWIGNALKNFLCSVCFWENPFQVPCRFHLEAARDPNRFFIKRRYYFTAKSFKRIWKSVVDNKFISFTPVRQVRVPLPYLRPGSVRFAPPPKRLLWGCCKQELKEIYFVLLSFSFGTEGWNLRCCSRFFSFVKYFVWQWFRKINLILLSTSAQLVFPLFCECSYEYVSTKKNRTKTAKFESPQCFLCLQERGFFLRMCTPRACLRFLDDDEYAIPLGRLSSNLSTASSCCRLEKSPKPFVPIA